MEEIIETPTLGLHSIEEYRPLVGDETVDRILAKAAALQDLQIANISSTQYGGGVAEILSYRIGDEHKHDWNGTRQLQQRWPG